MRATSYILAVTVSLLAVSALSIHRGALAATCLTEPNRQDGQSRHWHYHVDRVNHLNCWYVRKLETDEHQTASPTATVSSEPSETATLSSWFSWLTAALSRPNSTERQPENTKSNSRMIQTDPSAVLTIDDIVPKQRSVLRKSHFNRALKSAPQSVAQRSHQQSDPSMSQTDRDALFQEFLRWNDRQTTIP